MSLEAQGNSTFLAGYPGILPGYLGGARKVREKRVCSGSFARRGRSEIPHFCSKLQSFALVLQEKKREAKKNEKSEEKRRKRRQRGQKPPTPSTPTPLRTSQFVLNFGPLIGFAKPFFRRAKSTLTPRLLKSLAMYLPFLIHALQTRALGRGVENRKIPESG